MDSNKYNILNNHTKYFKVKKLLLTFSAILVIFEISNNNKCKINYEERYTFKAD